ncbi:succinate dehydrogenase subunit [Caenispirillum salinarum AK4]|uniref:Succinate dehydrogenase subunit n=1 Tax=Caenispirillum salinarum AK4 TaxID=1238182 RepID=K9H1J5_9PROT|nr:N(2)-acetyl-L-2,4-diaminobutanoate deacetylase DoeB [Caenispirillum salinarum]EKV31437.1 succinate dehydrogenase subunit [Caenispirillum salinarum AK4]
MSHTDRPAAGPATDAEKPSRVSCDVDLSAPGKQHGALTVPHSRDDSAWGSIMVPVTVINGGPGPTIVFTGGNHGDEYEGPISLLKLANRLTAEEISGRVIILPVMNLPAVRAAKRVSPIDGVNMNRAFPGRRDGSVTQMICHFIASRILPEADVVVDIHAGGKTLDFVPSAVIHDLPDPVMMEKSLAALKAFGAPLGLVLKELDSEGMLDTVVEDMGKVFISTELGGKGTATASTVAVADRGVRNMLQHFGLMKPTAEPDDPPAGVTETRIMGTPDGDCFVVGRHTGLYEPLVDLGEPVKAGQPIGAIHQFEVTGTEPAVYHARRDGILYCRHVPGLIQRGDCLAVIAVDR